MLMRYVAPGRWQLKLITQLIGLIIIIDDLTKFLTCLTLTASCMFVCVPFNLSTNFKIDEYLFGDKVSHTQFISLTF